MDKARLQEHINNFNQMCSEIGDDDNLNIKVKGSGGKLFYTDLKKGDIIIEAELIKREIIKIES